ncbi:hypothetical protein PCAR4_690030 [Paraburkholderia caribensis]|nr:hypothetical protein PCAR4_690030 [Paraburkholderia caribensis]
MGCLIEHVDSLMYDGTISPRMMEQSFQLVNGKIYEWETPIRRGRRHRCSNRRFLASRLCDGVHQ